ncbi:asparaginase [Phocicoccus pinnipedialis]|uniref:L-asparaginase II n=1 Tax=Phocicoccus pinnipedialis TaxID=110845 RepID=A0A6V7RNH3_9BACL|nr:asparaginase [Jeotgalicoccus pinnipedialis]MBP1938821.1 L-asparaginase II [Jeotgalicoccus pinnipedialis]CAD2079293.1 hypothetical protein JEOPIN946_01549 [Jeotgalicoccus pinnipedialis]
MNTKNKVKIFRNGNLESVHHIHAAVVDSKGEVLLDIGDPSFSTYARSSLKPFQALPLIISGAADKYGYTEEEIAVSCASHSGELIHRQTVQNILNKINEDENKLICGAHIPRDTEGFEKWVRSGNDITKIFNNCSGKHASMIATCKHTDQDIDSYYKPNHPLQVRIKQLILDICQLKESQIETGEDGCGLPVYKMPLNHLALGFCKLANPDIIKEKEISDAMKIIQRSMISSSHFVAGENRFDTDAMKVLEGKIVSKMGAEGVQGIGLVNKGIGIAVKVEDGANRGADIVGIHLLNHLGLIKHEEYQLLQNYFEPPILNTRGKQVGHIEFELEI